MFHKILIFQFAIKSHFNYIFEIFEKILTSAHQLKMLTNWCAPQQFDQKFFLKSDQKMLSSGFIAQLYGVSVIFTFKSERIDFLGLHTNLSTI